MPSKRPAEPAPIEPSTPRKVFDRTKSLQKAQKSSPASKNPEHALRLWLIWTTSYPEKTVITDPVERGQTLVVGLPRPRSGQPPESNKERMIARLNDLGLMPYASGVLPFFNGKTLPNEEKVNQVANVGDIVGYMLTIGNFNALAAIVSFLIADFGTPFIPAGFTMEWLAANYAVSANDPCFEVVAFKTSEGVAVNGNVADFCMIEPAEGCRSIRALENRLRQRGFEWATVTFPGDINNLAGAETAMYWVKITADIESVTMTLGALGIPYEIVVKE